MSFYRNYYAPSTVTRWRSRGAIASKYRKAGQTCSCANRIRVQDGIYDAFTKRLAETAGAMKVADRVEPGTVIGPLIDMKAVEKVEVHIADAVKKGAKVVLGGKRAAQGGSFFEPTVLSHVTTDMVITKEETFGPVAPLYRFKTDAEAIRMANDAPPLTLPRERRGRGREGRGEVPFAPPIDRYTSSRPGGRQRHRGLGREQEEGERLLQVEADRGIGVAQIADRNVLADVQVETAAAGRQDKGAGNRRGPDDFAVDDAPEVFQHRVSVISGFGDSGILVGAQQHRVGAVDADEAQPAQRVGDGVGVVEHIAREGLDRVAGSLTYPLDTPRGVALEDRAVFGKSDGFGGVLCRLPVRVVGAALDIVGHLAVQLERHAQLDQRLDLALASEDAVPRRCDVLQMPCAHGRKGGAARAVQIDDAASGEVALQGARRLLLDLRPRRIGN